MQNISHSNTNTQEKDFVNSISYNALIHSADAITSSVFSLFNIAQKFAMNKLWTEDAAANKQLYLISEYSHKNLTSVTFINTDLTVFIRVSKAVEVGLGHTESLNAHLVYYAWKAYFFTIKSVASIKDNAQNVLLTNKAVSVKLHVCKFSATIYLIYFTDMVGDQC